MIALRVVFAMLPLCSCGLLAWGTMLRLALVTRRRADWVLFGIALAWSMVAFGTVMTDPTEDLRMLRSDIAIGSLLLMAAAVMGYYLFAEIRHFSAGQAPPVPYYPSPAATASTHPAYGYPSQAGTAPVYRTPQAGPPAAPPHSSYPHTGAPARPPVPPAHPHAVTPSPQPHPQPQPQPQPQAKPTSQRIDQVRAELDELSDLLRQDPRGPREEGR
ncbi:hypothetical protein ACF068_18050 [Streptomyces sp. NPDC016309]|uniref:hypothetical protein n=1 Tax=Streptomyces sp. NPDC016309 TaxID=3364965 RepID=UPI0036F63BE0